MSKTVNRVITLLFMILLLAVLIPAPTPLAVYGESASYAAENGMPSDLTVAYRVTLSVTGYSLLLAMSALLASALTVWLSYRELGLDSGLALCLAVIPCSVLGAHVCYILTNIQYLHIDLGYNIFGFLFHLWEGGYTLYGAVLGGTAGIWLYARFTRRAPWELFNLAAPGAALALTIARLGEFFTADGIGKMIESELLQFFPLAVQNAWEEWYMAVFLYEALAACAIAVVAWMLLRKNGRAAEVFLILLGLTQILLESWRGDEFIRFGFVRFNQIASAVVMAAVLTLRIARSVKARGWSAWQSGRIALFLAGIGIIIAIEFALDKSSIDNRLLYVAMTATLAAMGVSLLLENPGALRRVKG